MGNLRGRVAVITGAGSGIGRALAHRLRREGCALALSDVDEHGLAETARALPPPDGSDDPLPLKTTTDRVDVADRAAVEAWAARVLADHGTAHFVVNNAGVALADLVVDMGYEDFEWLMNVNFWGVVHGTKAFLPRLLEQGAGHVVNLSSLFGLVGVPSQSAYCASKFAVRGFSESLRQELAGTGVGVSCVHPGGIRTNILHNARFRRGPTGDTSPEVKDRYAKMFRMTADDAARIIIEGVKRNRPRIIVGADASVGDWVQRVLPTGYAGLIARAIQR